MTDETKQPDLVEINDIHGFVHAIYEWHGNVLLRMKHLLTLPEGTEAIYMEADVETPIKLEGDAMKAFRAAVVSCVAELQDLPFVAETEPDGEDGTATSN